MAAAFVVAFVVLLLDGAAAVWLGQVWGRTVIVAVGLLLIACAVGVLLWHRRWLRDMAAIEDAKRELRHSIDDLRAVVAQARDHRRD